MDNIKLGIIYKRRPLDDYDNVLIGSYPKYMILTSVENKIFDEKRYTFLDLEWDGTLKIVITESMIHAYYYELVSDGDI